MAFESSLTSIPEINFTGYNPMQIPDTDRKWRVKMLEMNDKKEWNEKSIGIISIENQVI